MREHFAHKRASAVAHDVVRYDIVLGSTRIIMGNIDEVWVLAPYARLIIWHSCQEVERVAPLLAASPVPALAPVIEKDWLVVGPIDEIINENIVAATTKQEHIANAVKSIVCHVKAGSHVIQVDCLGSVYLRKDRVEIVPQIARDSVATVGPLTAHVECPTIATLLHAIMDVRIFQRMIIALHKHAYLWRVKNVAIPSRVANSAQKQIWRVVHDPALVGV